MYSIQQIFLQSDFFSEFDAHKNHLDKRYKLCHSCHNTVQHHLNLQEKDLKTFVLGTHLQKSKSTPTKLKVTGLRYYF